MTQHQIKLQYYKNQIRQRQRIKHFQKLRIEYYNNLPHEIKIHEVEVWKRYMKQPREVIPWEVVKQFTVYFQNQKVMQDIINKKLDASNIVNVVFVSKCVEEYEMETTNFFINVLAIVSQSGEDDHLGGVSKEVKSILNQNITQYKYEEEVYLRYFVVYLRNIPKNCKGCIQNIEKIRSYFIRYWNRFIDEGDVDYRLCASVTQRLFQFRKNITGLANEIQGIISVLICQDKSIQTYDLISKVMNTDIQLKFFIVLQSKLAQFIYDGLRKQATCTKSLMILGYIMQVDQFQKKTNLDYTQLLLEMKRQYLSTEISKTKQNILFAMFNFAGIDCPDVETFFLELDYQQMLQQSDSLVMYDFIDLCLEVLMGFGTEGLVEKVVFGRRVRVIELVCSYVGVDFGEKGWELARKLLGCLRYVGEAEIRVPLRGVVSDLQTMVRKLEDNQWHRISSQREYLLSEYEKLINDLSPIV